MLSRTILPGLAALALLWAAYLQAGQPMNRIEIVCDAGAQSECAALQTALAQSAPKAAISLSDPSAGSDQAALQVHLQILRREPTFVIARLAWSPPGAAPTDPLVLGPEVEVSASDTATLPTRSVKALVDGLLQVTPLPI